MLHTLGLHERKLTNVVQPSIPWKPKLIYVVNTNRETRLQRRVRGICDQGSKSNQKTHSLSLSLCVCMWARNALLLSFFLLVSFFILVRSVAIHARK